MRFKGTVTILAKGGIVALFGSNSEGNGFGNPDTFGPVFEEHWVPAQEAVARLRELADEIEKAATMKKERS
jgi:hypothetical protein